MDYFKLKAPDVEWNVNKALQVMKQVKDLGKYLEDTNKPEYLFWDKVRYKPRPKGMNAEEFWALVKLLRRLASSRVQTVIRDEKGNHFTWQLLPGLDYFLHEVDMKLGGSLESSAVEDQSIRYRFITRGIMEEAIASSQLEGANTTRKVAKRMLMEKRKPANRSEQMILNNYQAMIHIEESLRHENLTKELLLDLHMRLTQHTIDDADVGRLRTDADNIIVCDAARGVIYHIPPKSKFLQSELRKLIQYANDELPKAKFVHPLIKAIHLHFWIGYLHPFTDGNGRLARTLFYWYLIKNNYWAFSYLPVSRVIKNSPGQYRDAYIYSEQDDNDLTYFIDYNIRKISQAKKDFEVFVKRTETENRKMTKIARGKYSFNDRQIQLLRYMHKNSNATTTIKTHAQIYTISRVTARKELEELENMGFLTSQKIGRERPFQSTSKISKLFS